MQHHETVDALIERAVSQHPGQSHPSRARYFGPVLKELAPLARSLEANNLRVHEQLQGISRPRAVYTCGRYGNVYTALARRLSRCTQRRGREVRGLHLQYR
jgi:hypothetical protein